MANLDLAKRERVIAFNWLRNAHIHLETLVSDNNSTLRNLVSALDCFQSRVHEWEAAQHQVERIIAPELLVNECNLAYEQRNDMSNIILNAEEVIRLKRQVIPSPPVTPVSPFNPLHTPSMRPIPFTPPSYSDSNNNINVPILNSSNAPIFNSQNNSHLLNSSFSSNSTLNTSQIVHTQTSSKLDKLKLTEFGGNLEDWQNYWEIFESHVHNTNLPDVTKFTYLRNSLTGKAKKVVQGYAVTAVNYPIAIGLLQKRYGRNDIIIQNHIQSLLSDISVKIPPNNDQSKYISALWDFNDNILVHIRSLDALGIRGDSVEIFLCPIILSKLPESIRVKWYEGVGRRQGKLDILLNFLDEYITVLDDANNAKSKTANSDVTKNSTASALHSNSNSNVQKCKNCKRPNHTVEKCKKFLDLDVISRNNKISELKLCWKCLKGNHTYARCPISCTVCGKGHNRLLCKQHILSTGNNGVTGANSETPNASSNNSGLSPTAPLFSSPITSPALLQHCGNKISVLQTAKTKLISNSHDSVGVTILFDSGSDRSYILSDVAKSNKLKVMGWENVTFSAFGNKNSSSAKLSKIYKLNLLGVDNRQYSINVLEIDTICNPLFRQQIPSEMISMFNLPNLSDDYEVDRHIKVEILIGLDYLWDLIDPMTTVKHESLIAQYSVFGWVLSGSFASQNKSVSNVQMCCINISNDELKKFWSLEMIGINASTETMPSIEHSAIVKKFKQDIQFVNGHYVVKLLWKANPVPIVNNFSIARKRLETLYRFLLKHPKLLISYEKVFEDYESNNRIAEVPRNEIFTSANPIFYLPLFPIVKEKSLTSPVRPVLDGSARSFNNLGVNDALETGPCMYTNIFSILLRFRRHQIALCGDLKSAFHSVHLYVNDQDVCRFLLLKDGCLRHMKFLVLPFGLTCSPFLLNAVINLHLKSYPSSKTIIELLNNLYVDDFLSGADSVTEATEMYQEANKVMSEGGFVLTKWICSNDHVNHNVNIADLTGDTFVLGLNYNAKVDIFNFKGFSISEISTNLTKRLLLSYIAKLFDPLGFLSPYIMYAKILLQDVWRSGASWDQILPPKICQEFEKWLVSSKLLKEWHLSRIYFPGVIWSSISTLELHGFGDASEQGYGAVVYLRIQLPDGSYFTSFVCSRGRVAPVQRVSLPRLELLAAVLCGRLVKSVYQDLNLDKTSINVQRHYWTDSEIVINWIKTDPYILKTFVSNRVSELQTLSSPSQWHHCPGKINPSDLISRGCLVEDLINNNLWLYGPSWLQQPINFDTLNVESSLGDSMISEISMEYSSHALTCLVTSEINFDMSRFSNFSQILRIIIYILRFIHNSQHTYDRLTGPFLNIEYINAENRAIYIDQRNHFGPEIEALLQNKSLPKGSPLI